MSVHHVLHVFNFVQCHTHSDTDGHYMSTILTMIMIVTVSHSGALILIMIVILIVIVKLNQYHDCYHGDSLTFTVIIILILVLVTIGHMKAITITT